ncbi:hypothetical protein Q1695_016195 [Nippostrongylus brasiliensis]|nr:hypothetical protein Q1695_016195 [Nippostrongylus brasiliensis]
MRAFVLFLIATILAVQILETTAFWGRRGRYHPMRLPPCYYNYNDDSDDYNYRKLRRRSDPPYPSCHMRGRPIEETQ